MGLCNCILFSITELRKRSCLKIISLEKQLAAFFAFLIRFASRPLALQMKEISWKRDILFSFSFRFQPTLSLSRARLFKKFCKLPSNELIIIKQTINVVYGKLHPGWGMGRRGICNKDLLLQLMTCSNLDTVCPRRGYFTAQIAFDWVKAEERHWFQNLGREENNWLCKSSWWAAMLLHGCWTEWLGTLDKGYWFGRHFSMFHNILVRGYLA